jgi:SAM-dependent methyltransferase
VTEDFIQRLVAEHPDGWFEPLYAAAAQGAAELPWDRGECDPMLVEWLEARGDRAGARALVVGSGLGRDAEHLAGLGYDTTASDVSPTAIATTRARFPDSPVRYVAADLLDPPAQWRHAFDLVLESFTVQAMPPSAHPAAIVNVAGFVAPGGTLLVHASNRVTGNAHTPPPWPLTRDEVDAFGTRGLVPVRIEELPHPEGRDRTRWRAEFHRPA